MLHTDSAEHLILQVMKTNHLKRTSVSFVVAVVVVLLLLLLKHIDRTVSQQQKENEKLHISGQKEVRTVVSSPFAHTHVPPNCVLLSSIA